MVLVVKWLQGRLGREYLFWMRAWMPWFVLLHSVQFQMSLILFKVTI